MCAFAIICAISFLRNFNSHIAQNYLQIITTIKQDNSSDGRVATASASGAADLGLIPSRIKPVTLKLVFTAFVLDAQRYCKGAVWRTSRQVYLLCR